MYDMKPTIKQKNSSTKKLGLGYLTDDLPPVPLRTRCPTPLVAKVESYRGRSAPQSAKRKEKKQDVKWVKMDEIKAKMEPHKEEKSRGECGITVMRKRVYELERIS